MQIFAFQDEKDITIVVDVFKRDHDDWTVSFIDRDKWSGFPSCAVSSYDHTAKILNFTFLSPGEVSRVAAVLDGRLVHNR